MMNYLYFPINKGNNLYHHVHKYHSPYIKLNSYKDDFVTTSQCSSRFKMNSKLQFINVIDSHNDNDNESAGKRKANVSFIKTTKLNFNKINTCSVGDSNKNKNKYKAITDRNKCNESGCVFYKRKRLYKSSSCGVEERKMNCKKNSKCVNKRNNLSSVIVSGIHNWKYQHNRKDSLYSTKGNTTCDDSKNHCGKVGQDVKVESVEDAHVNFVRMIQETKNILILKEQGSNVDISFE